MKSSVGSRKEMLFGQLLTSIEQKFRRDDGKACQSRNYSIFQDMICFYKPEEEQIYRE